MHQHSQPPSTMIIPCQIFSIITNHYERQATWGRCRCKRFASIFDDNGDGLIELDELGSPGWGAWQGEGNACCQMWHGQNTSWFPIEGDGHSTIVQFIAVLHYCIQSITLGVPASCCHICFRTEADIPYWRWSTWCLAENKVHFHISHCITITRCFRDVRSFRFVTFSRFMIVMAFLHSQAGAVMQWRFGRFFQGQGCCLLLQEGQLTLSIAMEPDVSSLSPFRWCHWKYMMYVVPWSQ